MISAGSAMTVVSVGGGSIPVPGLVFVPHNFCRSQSLVYKMGVLKIKQCSLLYLIQLCCAGPRVTWNQTAFQVLFQVH